MSRLGGFAAAAAALLLAAAALGVLFGGGGAAAAGPEKVLRVPMTTSGPGSLDPVLGSTTYENRTASCLYETLLQYKYLARPLDLEPLLLETMPEVMEGGLVWRFTLRKDVYFHDDPCFEETEGKGRALVAEDVIYSWKRLADPEYSYKNWWLVDGQIKGFNEYKAHQARRLQVKANADELAGLAGAEVAAALIEIDAKRAERALRRDEGRQPTAAEKAEILAAAEAAFEPWLREKIAAEFHAKAEKDLREVEFDYDAPVEGMRITGTHTFEVELTAPLQQFIWKLAMFQLSVVPREAVEKYGERFSAHPVGTGPFVLKDEDDWRRGSSILMHRNPNYREAYYPDEWEAKDEELGLHEPAGRRIPFVDAVEFTFYVETQPNWLEFRAGNEDFTTLPQSAFDEAFSRRTKDLRRSWERKGVRAVKVPLLDFIFRSFNMEDPLVGGYTDEKRAFRQAMNLAMDWDEMNETFYFGMAIPYDGPIPPGLDGHPNNDTHRAPFSTRGPNLELARQKLREAGYTIGPDGRATDVPTVDLYTSAGAESQRIVELLQRNLAEVGIDLNPRYLNFSDLIQAVNNRKAPFFSFAWGSDYPDAENNLALFYSPNASPGSNHSNYSNPEYDRLYELIQTMPEGTERRQIYEQMRDMLIKDAPFCGSLARTRVYLIHPWVKYFKPTEDFYTYFKYLDIDTNHPERGR